MSWRPEVEQSVTVKAGVLSNKSLHLTAISLRSIAAGELLCSNILIIRQKNKTHIDIYVEINYNMTMIEQGLLLALDFYIRPHHLSLCDGDVAQLVEQRVYTP